MDDHKLFDITQNYNDDDSNDTFSENTTDEDDTFTDEEIHQFYVELKEDEEDKEEEENEDEESTASPELSDIIQISEDEIDRYLIEIEEIRLRENDEESEPLLQTSEQCENDINDVLDDLDNILLSQPLSSIEPTTVNIPVTEQSEEPTHLICNKCFNIFFVQYQLDEHMSIHENETENAICMCQRCKLIFNSDEEYLAHNYNCTGTEGVSGEIPTDETGEYGCPSCDNRYSNQFLLGEHFMQSHNDYDELSVLDKKTMIETINGFPGLNLLEKIDMTRYVSFNDFENLSICKICYFDYIIEEMDEMNEMNEDNRNPIILNCCNRMICCNCLIRHLSINNNLVCPYCIRDHCRDDWSYVTFIDEMDVTDRNKWIPWWSKHLDIFY